MLVCTYTISNINHIKFKYVYYIKFKEYYTHNTLSHVHVCEHNTLPHVHFLVVVVLLECMYTEDVSSYYVCVYMHSHTYTHKHTNTHITPTACTQKTCNHIMCVYTHTHTHQPHCMYTEEVILYSLHINTQNKDTHEPQGHREDMVSHYAI